MQICGHAVAGDDSIEVVGAFQFAAILRGEVAVAAEAARDLPRTVSAEIEVDTDVAVANIGHRLVAFVDDNKWQDEFVGDAAVVRFLHALHRIQGVGGLALAVNHGVECLLFALPAAVAVHGVVAAADCGDLADAVFAHLLLQLLDVAGAVGGQRVAAIHEAVHEDALHAVLFSHPQERVKMILVRVDAAIRKQSEQMQPAPASTGSCHCIQQRGIGEERHRSRS